MRVPPALWFSVLVVGSSGCFEATTEVSLAADGSGTQTVRLGLAAQALGTLRGAIEAADASATRVDPLDVFDAKKVRTELETAGLALEAHRTFEEQERRVVELRVRFAGLATLRQNPLAGGTRATWQVSRGPGPDDVRLVYFPQGEAAWKAARAKARELAQEPDATVQHFVQSRLRQVEGLDVRLTLALPGDIIAHTANLQLDDKRKVTARIRASDIRSATDLLVRLAPRYEIVFACPGFPVEPVSGGTGETNARKSAPDPASVKAAQDPLR